jgi:hypothetical protein
MTLVSRTTLVIATSVAAAAGVPVAHAATQRHFHATCHSGETAFRRGALRAFKVSVRDPHTGGPRERLLLCTPASSKPRLILDGGADSTISPISFVIQGTRLGVEVQTVEFMSPVAVAPTEVGWIDVRGGPARFGLLNVGVDPQYVTPDEPLLPVDKVSFAIAPDGSMAVIAAAKSGCQAVAVLAIRTKPSPDGDVLDLPAVLYTAPHGGLDPASLTIDRTTVAWRTVGGSPGSAPRSAGTSAAGGPAAQTGGC